MMSLTNVTPAEARDIAARGAVLVDIREDDEYARQRIAGARHAPLSRFDASQPDGSGQTVIYYCRTGNRTDINAAALAAAAGGHAYAVAGGIEAWKRDGFKVETDTRRPIEIMRQVQITAGSLILLGVLLGALVHPAFYALAGFVGAGLVMAGATGSCLMARLLGTLPWNRVRETTPAPA